MLVKGLGGVAEVQVGVVSWYFFCGKEIIINIIIITYFSLCNQVTGKCS